MASTFRKEIDLGWKLWASLAVGLRAKAGLEQEESGSGRAKRPVGLAGRGMIGLRRGMTWLVRSGILRLRRVEKMIRCWIGWVLT